MSTEQAQYQERFTLDDREQTFLQAWKQGVRIAGINFFHARGVEYLDRVTHWRQLQPDLALIRKGITNRSQGDASFLAIMSSFFNETEGQKLLDKTGTTIGKLPIVLSPAQRQIYLDLFQNFGGW